MNFDTQCELPEHKVFKWLWECRPIYSKETDVAAQFSSSEDIACENKLNLQSGNSGHLSGIGCLSRSSKSKPRACSLPKSVSCEYFSDASSKSKLSDTCAPKFRRLYVNSERRTIINYIVEHNLFHQIKGNVIWQKMEELRICARTWQSMKSQFRNHILPHIDKFNLPCLVKNKFLNVMKSSPKREPGFMQAHERGWRENVNYYTFEEDVNILKYVLQKERYKLTHGNVLWVQMCEDNIFPKRTWQSVKSRFFTILPYLSRYKLTEDLVNKLLTPPDQSISRKVTCSRNLLAKSQGKCNLHKNNTKSNKKSTLKEGFSEESTSFIRKCDHHASVKRRQKIRKRAIMTGLCLASKLKSTKTPIEPKKDTSVKESLPDVCKMDENRGVECQNLEIKSSSKIRGLTAEELTESPKNANISPFNLSLNINSSEAGDVSSILTTDLVTTQDVLDDCSNKESDENVKLNSDSIDCHAASNSNRNEVHKESATNSNLESGTVQEGENKTMDCEGEVLSESESYFDGEIVLRWNYDTDVD